MKSGRNYPDRYTAAAYEKSVAAIKAAAGQPFALMPGCDLPYGVPMENLQMMAKAVADTSIFDR